jgi:Family of unknown function (DUF6886)
MMLRARKASHARTQKAPVSRIRARRRAPVAKPCSRSKRMRFPGRSTTVAAVRDPAPPYVGERPHALWHVSEDAAIDRFEPHVSRTAASTEPRVWAVDTRHLPLYWFPRECPRGTFWATPRTAEADLELLTGATRVHAVEGEWLSRIRAAHVVAYRLPEQTFAPDPEVGGYWLSREPVVPVEVVELGDLLELHAESGVELRLVENLWPLWNRVIASSLEFSGIRLHNAKPPPETG